MKPQLTNLLVGKHNNFKGMQQSFFVLCSTNRDRAHRFVICVCPKCFYWLVVHFHFTTFCVLYSQDQQTKYIVDREQKHLTKKLVSFDNRTHFINCGETYTSADLFHTNLFRGALQKLSGCEPHLDCIGG